MKEDMAEGGRVILPTLLEDRAGPKDRSYREGGFHSIKETFLTELLNNEWTAREVVTGSVQGGKTTLEKGLLHLLRG